MDEDELLTEDIPPRYLTATSRFWKRLKFLQPQELVKVCIFGPALGPIYPRKTKNTVKNQNFYRNCIVRNIKWYSFQVPGKSRNFYKNYQKKPVFGAKNVLFKVKNSSKIKDQEVRDQIIITFSKFPNSGITVGEIIFVLAQLKLEPFQF